MNPKIAQMLTFFGIATAAGLTALLVWDLISSTKKYSEAKAAIMSKISVGSAVAVA